MHALCLGLGEVLGFLLTAFQVLVVVQWVFWLVSADPSNPIVRAVGMLVEPPLAWLRLRLPWLRAGAWDLSPMAALLICSFLDQVLLARFMLWAAQL